MALRLGGPHLYVDFEKSKNQVKAGLWETYSSAIKKIKSQKPLIFDHHISAARCDLKIHRRRPPEVRPRTGWESLPNAHRARITGRMLLKLPQIILICKFVNI